MKPIYVTVFFLLVSTYSLNQAWGGEDWKLKRDKEGIQIYTRKVEGSPYKAVRGVTVVQASLSSLVALIRDSAACPQWADRCARSYIHESISELEDLVYTLNDLPWPVADRDVLARVRWSQTTEDFVVTMTSQATTDILKKKKGVVRLTEAQAKWIFTPLNSGQVQVITEAHINPGGPLPAWVTNMLLIDSPFNTLVGLRKAVADKKYQSAKVSFIREPDWENIPGDNL